MLTSSPLRWFGLVAVLVMGGTASRLSAAQLVERTELSCGLPLIIAESQAVPLVAVRLAVRAGTAHEGELAGSGVAAVALRLSEQRLRAAMSDVGASVTTDLAPGVVGFTVQATPELLPGVLTALADLAQQPAPGGFQLDQERTALGTLTSVDVQAAVIGALDPNHPARWPAAGLPAARELLTPTALHAWRLDRWRAGRAVLAVVGNVRPLAVRAQAEQAFAGFPPGGISESIRVAVNDRDRRRTVIAGATDAPRVVVALPIPSWGSAEYAAVCVARRWLEPRLAEVDGSVTLWVNPDEPARVAVTVPLLSMGCAASEYVVTRLLAELAERSSSEAIQEAKRSELMALGQDQTALVTYATQLTMAELLIATPESWARQVQAVAAVEPEAVRLCAKQWWVNGNQLRAHATVTVTAPTTTTELGPIAPPATNALVAPTVETLPSGFRVAIRVIPDAPLASVHLRFAHAVELENTDQRGVSALLAAMLVRATETRTPEDIAAWCAAHGLRLTASVEAGDLELRVLCQPQELSAAVELLADLATRAALPPDEMERVRSFQLSALSAHQSWQTRLTSEVARVLTPMHPAARLADSLTIHRIDRSMLVAQQRQLLVGGNGVLAISGAGAATALMAMITDRFGAIPSGNVTVPAIAAATTQPGLVTVNWDGGTCAAALAWSVPPSTAANNGTEEWDQPAVWAVFERAVAKRVTPTGWMVQRLTALQQRAVLIGGAVESSGAVDGSLARIRALVAQALRLGDVASWPERDLEAVRSACLVTWAQNRADVDRTASDDAARLVAHQDPAVDASWPTRIRAVTRAQLLHLTAFLSAEPTVVVLQAQPATSGSSR